MPKPGIDRPRTPRPCGYGGHSRQLWAYFLTPRVYAGALHRVTELVGTNRPLATVDDTEILWPYHTVGQLRADNRNRNRSAVASARSGRVLAAGVAVAVVRAGSEGLSS
jgi:hypothetical protein